MYALVPRTVPAWRRRWVCMLSIWWLNLPSWNKTAANKLYKHFYCLRFERKLLIYEFFLREITSSRIECLSNVALSISKNFPRYRNIQFTEHFTMSKFFSHDALRSFFLAWQNLILSASSCLNVLQPMKMSLVPFSWPNLHHRQKVCFSPNTPIAPCLHYLPCPTLPCYPLSA